MTLSPLAAERLGVRIVEVGAAETPRWAPAGDPEPPAPRSRHVCVGERGASLEFVPDPAMPPEMAAERAERAERAAARPRPVLPANPADPRLDDAPRPSLLLGLGLTPWPGPGGPFGPPCPACGDRALRRHVYCLVCDRWGSDAASGAAATPDLEPEKARARPPARTRSRNEPSPDGLRAERKARRKARLQAKVDAAKARKARPQAPTGGAVKPRETPTPAPRGNRPGC